MRASWTGAASHPASERGGQQDAAENEYRRVGEEAADGTKQPASYQQRKGATHDRCEQGADSEEWSGPGSVGFAHNDLPWCLATTVSSHPVDEEGSKLVRIGSRKHPPVWMFLLPLEGLVFRSEEVHKVAERATDLVGVTP